MAASTASSRSSIGIAAGLALIATVATARVTEAQPAPGALRTLIIEVMQTDRVRNETRPVAGALVRVQGGEDDQPTDAKGRARLANLAAEKVMLQIMMVGAEICRLADVPVVGGDLVVRVLMDKDASGPCRRLQ